MSKNILDTIYNPEKLLEGIAFYRNADLKSLSLNEIIENFKKFISQYNLITSNLKCSLFRVRKIEQNKLHTKTEDVWCPPSKYVKKLGRLNDIGESIFYASFDPLTSIRETRINPGDDFSLAIYELSQNKSGIQSTINIEIPSVPIQIMGNKRIHSMILSDFIF